MICRSMLTSQKKNIKQKTKKNKNQTKQKMERSKSKTPKSEYSPI